MLSVLLQTAFFIRSARTKTYGTMKRTMDTKCRRNLQPITICNATDRNLYGTRRKHTELHIELLIVLPEANNTRTYVSMKTEEEPCNIIFFQQ